MIQVPFGRHRCAILSLVALTLLVTALPLPLRAAASDKSNGNAPFSAIYVIGDSLSDTGRASARLSQPMAPFPPFPYAEGRLSNGPLWIEYFSPMVRRAYSAAENYAVAGALTGPYEIPGAPPGTPKFDNVYSSDLLGMTRQLKQLSQTSTLPLDRKALYVVFGGINDTFLLNLPVTPQAAANIISNGVNHLLCIVVELRVLGAEKIVVVDLPDLGLTPRAQNLGGTAPATATQFSREFNAALNNVLNSAGPICRVSAFDLMRDFVARPKHYGFTNVTTAFMDTFNPANPDLSRADTYLFWDDLHPTTRAHQHFADEVYHAVARAGMFGNNPK